MPYKTTENRFQRWAQGNFKKSISKSQSIEIPGSSAENAPVLPADQSIESSLHHLEVYNDEVSALSFAEKMRKFQDFDSASNAQARGTLIYGTLPKNTRFSLQPEKKTSRERAFSKLFQKRRMSRVDSQQTELDLETASLPRKPTRSILKSSSYRNSGNYQQNSSSTPLARDFFSNHGSTVVEYGAIDVDQSSSVEEQQQLATVGNLRESQENDEPIEV